MGSLIVVENLVKRYGERPDVLGGVSFSIEAGDFVTIYGKSGCGKTTLLNIMGGLDRPSAGSILFEGKDMFGLSENELAEMRLSRIGFVFQDYNLLPDLTVRENLALPLRLSKRKDGRRVEVLLGKFDLEHIADVKSAKISGGEAQRTAIARAMTNEPVIVLADEPTGNLDRGNAENVIDMFQLARTEFHTTIVLATHDENLTSEATRRMFLHDGVIDLNGGGQ
jgi:putative ABC transport system ATP-binding protein